MSWKITEKNEKLINKIRQTICNGRISHAYIFEGDSNADKVRFANDFLKALFCREKPGDGCDECVSCRKIDQHSYEDIYMISGSGDTRSVRDELVEETLIRLKRKPNLERNVIVINDADNLTIRAQNHLLKILEEPPGDSLIILLAENISNLLPTVNSRCIKFRLPDDFGGYVRDITDNELLNVLLEKINVTDFVKQVVLGDPFYKVKSSIEEIAKNRDSALFFLDEIEKEFEKILREEGYRSSYSNDEIFKIICLIEKTRRAIQLGGSRAYALKKMVLQMSK